MKKKLLLSLVASIVVSITLIPNLLFGGKSKARVTPAQLAAAKKRLASPQQSRDTKKVFVPQGVNSSESALIDHLKQAKNLLADLTKTGRTIPQQASVFAGEINLLAQGPIALPVMTQPMEKPMIRHMAPTTEEVVTMDIMPVTEEEEPEKTY